MAHITCAKTRSNHLVSVPDCNIGNSCFDLLTRFISKQGAPEVID